MDHGLRLYEENAGIVKNPESIRNAARQFHAAVGKKVADNMTAAQRVARASAGGYARAAAKMGITVAEYLKSKKTADKLGLSVAEYVRTGKGRRRKPKASGD